MSFGYGFGLPSWQPLSGGFNPSSLFVGGVQGAFFDPSDSSTLFSDTAGTTPSPTPGGGALSVVGLMLDKSQGLVLGSELITNGDFSQGSTGWTTETGWSVGSGVATSTGGSNTIYQASSAIIGNPTRVTFTIVSRSGDTAVRVRCGSGFVSSSFTTPGTYSVTVVSPTTGLMGFYGDGTTGSISIDNISFRLLPGNHAISYNTTTARPELSARVNLLTYSEQFDNVAWTKVGLNAFGSGSVANTTATTDPLGGNTADFIQEDSLSNGHGVYFTTGMAAGSYVFSCAVKAAGRNFALLRLIQASGSYAYAVFDLSNNIVSKTATIAGAAITSATSSISPLGNGWYRCVLTAVSSSAFGFGPGVGACTTGNPTISAFGDETYTGNGTSGIYIWGADLRPANIGTSVPAYQRIADQYTYDSSGFPRYLVFNGTASGMYTPASIPFAAVTSDGQARRNLLLNPTQFDVSTVWVPTGTAPTVTANAVVAPDNTTTADRLVFSVSGIANRLSQALASSTGAVPIQLSVYLRGEVGGEIMLVSDGWTISSDFVLTTGWQRFVFSTTGNAASTNFLLYAKSGTPTVYAWGAQLETGSTATAFQNIGTDKATVFAGVRKQSDAADAILTEFSANTTTNNGAFYIAAPESAASLSYSFLGHGSATVAVTQRASTPLATYPAPRTNVLACTGDIAGDLNTIRVNGVAGTSATGDQGTGNFGNYPLYIGSRANASLFLNGYIYSLIVVGAASTAAQISSTESWINGKEGTVY